MNHERMLPRNTNQVRGLAEYALEFLHGDAAIGPTLLKRTELFFIDSVVCGMSALAAGANAPLVLRREALDAVVDATRGASVIGSSTFVRPEKAILANCAAVREWDSNGTNFGYDPVRGNTAGEFGHNDFYPVAVALGQLRGWNGAKTLRAMVLIDEIRGRLAEVFSLKSHKIDHVVHGAIASAVVYAAAHDATIEQIESAVGLFVAHAIPFRAIRYGKQLSDSKGASAAISTEFAVLCAQRALAGFIGPADIFRNPEAIFALFEKPSSPESSPFDLALATGGDEFAVMGMHFKLGLYEHQSAGAIQGLLDVLAAHPALLEDAAKIETVRIAIYEPAYHIICDPYKRRPTTRQSADHSLPYIVATTLRKALAARSADWERLMLLPADYDDAALVDPLTRTLMDKIELVHGGIEFDRRYPEGIPTQVAVRHADLGEFDSGLVMFPTGHARNTTAPLERLLQAKFALLAGPAVENAAEILARLGGLAAKSPAEVRALWSFALQSDNA